MIMFIGASGTATARGEAISLTMDSGDPFFVCIVHMYWRERTEGRGGQVRGEEGRWGGEGR